MPQLLPLFLLALLLGCGRSPIPEGEPPTDSGSGAAEVGSPTQDGTTSSDPADWRAYPAPESDEWPTRPLDDDRWVAVSGDLGCVGRAHHGDPAAHRAGMNAVLAHHATKAADVMEYGIAVNGDSRAGTLGAKVSDAVQTCR